MIEKSGKTSTSFVPFEPLIFSQWLLTPETSLNTRRRTNRNFLDTEFSCWEGGRDGSKTTSGDKETEQRYKRLNSWRTKRQDATPCRSVWPSTMIPSVDTVHRQWTCWYTAFWDEVTVKIEQVGNNKFVAAQDIVPSWTVDAFYFMSLDAPASFRRNPTMYEIEEIPICRNPVPPVRKRVELIRLKIAFGHCVLVTGVLKRTYF